MYPEWAALRQERAALPFQRAGSGFSQLFLKCWGTRRDSIADHSAYLLGAKNGSKLRYAGLKGCTDYKKAVRIIKDGGYATSLTYVEKLCSIIEKWNLTQCDAKDSGGEAVRWYCVRKTWADSKSQKGAYKVLANAKKCADQNPGYKVFDADGKVVYEPKAAEPAVKVPFLVRVKN